MVAAPLDWFSSEDEGFVTSTTRRWIYFCTQAGELEQGTIATKALDITVGDKIHFQRGVDEYLIDDYQERKNCLKRQVGKKSKLLCANVDVLMVVSAVGKLFQPNFVDRVLCVATLEGIETVLVVNKVDLEVDPLTQHYIDVYRSLGIEVLETTTKIEGGLDPVLKTIKRDGLRVVSLVGVSGVGKSSILNLLVPEAERDTRQVSEKSGQGRQTTSQAEAFRYQNPEEEVDLFLIDLPGVQNFGMSHLEERDVQRGMPDIAELAAGCEYADCQHIAEPNCAVKEAFELGEFPVTRFESYITMREEIERMREY